jgi:fatty acid desaturase
MNSKTDWAPPTLPGLSKMQNSSGISYTEFRKTLITPFNRVQMSIAMNLVLIISAVILALNYPYFTVLVFLAIPLALIEHRVLNVLHEGAHYLIAKKRSMNDLVTNVLSGWFVIADVDQYRITHIQHHRNLGSFEDPKLSHMDKLDFTWLVSAISGFKTLSIVIQRKKFRETKLKDYKPKSRHFLVPLIGIVIHISIVMLIAGINLNVALWWIITSYILAPFLGILRNVLEHRYLEKIDSRVWDEVIGRDNLTSDYSQVTTRMFTISPLSQIWGSMGFTRHLIHHWDPSISYIHLKKVNIFLLDTKIGPLLQSQETTFSRTVKALWNKDYDKG